MNGGARPFAALCAMRCFLYRSLSSSLHVLRPLGGYPHLLLTESSMNGTARPSENSTANIAILPLVYFFAQGMYLHLNQGRVSRQVCAVPR